MIRSAFALVLLPSVFVAPAHAGSGDAGRAKAYLAEVKKHLRESYVEGSRLSDRDLVRAGLDGFRTGLAGPEFRGLSATARIGIGKALREAVTLDQALEGAVGAAGGEKFDLIRFADHAARSMVRFTGDPFSRILTQEEFRKLLRILQSGTQGEELGALVGAKDGKVRYVRYGTAAYEEGIEIGDEIVEIDRTRLAGLHQAEVNELLQLSTDRERTIVIRKAGLAGRIELRVRGRGRTAPLVQTKYLGQGVGYLRLSMFDMRAAGEVRKGLDRLKGQGMEALILDLRHNPGGALPVATAIADLFLPQGLVITRTHSSYRPRFGSFQIPGAAGNQIFRTRRESPYEKMPMVVLVDRASASASELLAGALQDHRRAVVVGRTTYGKGVGQSPIFLTSMFLRRYLYLTVMTYDLPSGRSIHHKGVVPDLTGPREELSTATKSEVWRLRTRGALSRYVNRQWGSAEARLRKLAEYDRFDPGLYPGFEELYRSLETSLTRDQIRAEVRRAIRRRLSRREGAVWPADLEADLILQRGLVALLEK